MYDFSPVHIVLYLSSFLRYHIFHSAFTLMMTSCILEHLQNRCAIAWLPNEQVIDLTVIEDLMRQVHALHVDVLCFSATNISIIVFHRCS